MSPTPSDYQILIIGGLHNVDPANDNVDIEVIFPSGARYFATLFTVENIRKLMGGYRLTGECKEGLYFWASDMIIVQAITEEVIQQTVEGLIASRELELACPGPHYD